MSDQDLSRFILDKLEKIDDKVDDIKVQGEIAKEQLKEQSFRLAEYNNQLTIHVKRTDLLEQKVEKVEADVEETKPIVEDFKVNQSIIKRRIARLKKITLILGLIGTVVSIIFGLPRI